MIHGLLLSIMVWGNIEGRMVIIEGTNVLFISTNLIVWPSN